MSPVPPYDIGLRYKNNFIFILSVYIFITNTDIEEVGCLDLP
jgi:hypothetical protein